MKIDLEQVTFTYSGGEPEYRAVEAVSLSIGPGEFVALVGPSGCGKTTLIQLLNGLLKPMSGMVKVDGVDIWQKGYSLGKLRRRIGLVFQFPEAQLFEQTVYRDVAFGLRNMRQSDAEIDDEVRKALRAVDMPFSTYSERSPLTLSAGEQRRVAIAGILAMSPELLVLDEPGAGLDYPGVQSLSRTLRSYHSDERSVLLISHDMELVFSLADRVILMDGGRIRFDGSKHKLLHEEGLLSSLSLSLPRSTLLARFLHSRGLLQRDELLTGQELLKEIQAVAKPTP